MTNLFLKVNKDFFKLGLNPTEILILSQVAEFNTNTGDCFMSDEAFAEMLCISKSTVSREMKVLEEKGFITRETKNIKGGKVRHITINLNNIESHLTNVNLTVEGSTQTSICLLTNVNLPIDNKQNESIKDNIKEIKKKDKVQTINELIQSSSSDGKFKM